MNSYRNFLSFLFPYPKASRFFNIYNDCNKGNNEKGIMLSLLGRTIHSSQSTTLQRHGGVTCKRRCCPVTSPQSFKRHRARAEKRVPCCVRSSGCLSGIQGYVGRRGTAWIKCYLTKGRRGLFKSYCHHFIQISCTCPGHTPCISLAAYYHFGKNHS